MSDMLTPLEALGYWALFTGFAALIGGLIVSECESLRRFLFGAVLAGLVVTISCASAFSPYIDWGR